MSKWALRNSGLCVVDRGWRRAHRRSRRLSWAAAIDAAGMAQYGGDWRPGAGWDRDIDVRCASQGYGYFMCQVDTGQGSRVNIVKQISDTRCVEGRNWGWNRAGIWVDQGCEGDLPRTASLGGWPRSRTRSRSRSRSRSGPGTRRRLASGCRLEPGNRPALREQQLPVQHVPGRHRPAAVSVRVQRQISKTRCVEGRNWGWNRAGIWVDQGCEAEFRIDRRWR